MLEVEEGEEGEAREGGEEGEKREEGEKGEGKGMH